MLNLDNRTHEVVLETSFSHLFYMLLTHILIQTDSVLTYDFAFCVYYSVRCGSI